MKSKTLIWAWPTRAFHWLLAIGFASAYILEDFDDYRQFHFAFGSMVGVLLVMRIIYGLIGPQFSRFSQFPVGLSNQVDFLKSVHSGKSIFYGHNPLASLVMLGIFFLGILTSLSGYLMYLSKSQAFTFFTGGEFMEEIHEVFANLFLGLVIFHLVGVLVDLLLHGKNGAFGSIFNGIKNVETKPAIANALQQFFGIIWIVTALAVFYLAFNIQPLVKDNDKTNNYSKYE
ncbi:MAG: cytochrome b/b6 domain-containing protein, partial [Bacteroidales bacterium]|nr:cytochrome b/b6 domain-containing protein [Bacteroidales bacterium]